jgi:hypothetical protein
MKPLQLIYYPPGSSPVQHGGLVESGGVSLAGLLKNVFSLLILQVFKNHSPFRLQLSAGPKGG